jgi:ABC-2 type transport system permease protein
MSSVASAAAAPIAAPLSVRRPSTLVAYRWELRKLISQKRTYLGVGLGIALPVIFVVVQNVHTRHGGGDSIFAAQITQSGLATPVLMLLFESVFFLPLIASLVAGDIVAAEDNNGTLKTILTRSVDRGQLFAAKALAALTYAVIAVYLATLIAIVGGVASWGFDSIKTFSGSTVSASEGLLLVIAANACYLIPLAGVVCIALLLSTATRNSIAGVGGAIGIVILMYIIAGIPGLEGIKPYLLTEQFENWHGLLRTPTDWAPVTHSLWVTALYAVPSLVAGYLVFLRRDVAGG